MTVPTEVRRRFYLLRAAAFIVGLPGIACVILGARSSGFLFVGLMGIVVGLWLVRRSNALALRARGQMTPGLPPASALRRVGPLAWALTGVSLLACLASYYALYLDGLHGGKEVWPVYALLGAGLALVVTSGYVAMRIFQ